MPKQPPQVLMRKQLRKVLETCEGKDFYARRDRAIILMLDTGMRRAEIGNLEVVDLDFEQGLAQVVERCG